jgi:Tol biopolymer transport system component/beta-lactamase regulating signal transducer with metallopeptidase domain
MEAVMTYAQAFFGWLLQTTLIASVVICLILLIQKLLGGRLGPRWCHALWLVLLVRMVLPWSPSSRVSLSNLIPSWQRQTQSQQSLGAVEVQEVSPTEQAAEAPKTTTSQEPESELAAKKQIAPKPRIVAGAEDQSGYHVISFRRILPIIWLAGAIVIGMYLLVSDLALWRIVKRDRPLLNQAMLELFEECKAQMGVQSLLVVVPSDRVRSPGLFGFVRPRLLLPTEMLNTATIEEMRFVFLHELAHLKRRDIYIGWLTSLLQVLHWFNPLIWFAFYRMRADRELACDALVLTRTGQDKSQEYGGAIVDLVRRFSRPRPLPAMAGIIESKSQLKRRIAMITKFRNKSYRFSPLAVVLIIILASISLPNAISMQTSKIYTKESAPPISLRRIWAGPGVDLGGAPSPDGEYISYVDWDTGDLAVYEVATGKKRRLTNKGSWDESDEFAEFSRWSPEGKRIVYDWYNKDYFIELRIVGLDGSEPRILYRNKEVTWARTYDWSPDGKQILACFSTKEGDQIVLVSVEDGSVRILKTLKRYYPQNMVFSPDGRYIVYDFPQKESSLESDIFQLLADGSREIPLIVHPADDCVLGWTPDGKNILFISDRTGSPCMWSIAIADGRVQGIPKLIRKDIGQKFRSMGFTKEGSYYYGCGGEGGFDVYIAKLDLQTGKVLSPPQKAIQRFEGHNATPDYSPDGKYMAYVSHRGSRHQILCIRSLESGQEQEFPSKLMRMTDPKWSPEGNFILIAGMDYNINRYGNYQVDPKTGIFTPVLLPSKEFRFNSHEWSRDGESYFMGRSSVKNKHSQIMLREIKRGKEKEIYHLPRLERFRLACSPDGKWLAFINMRNDSALRIIPSAGGEPRELYRCEPKKEQLLTCKWTTDGKYILFVIRKIEQKESSLWRIPVEGGEAQKIDLGINIGGLSIHPDGQHIAFGTRENQPAEVWVMENFLPEATVAKPELAPTLVQIEVRGRGTRHSRPSFDGNYFSDVDRDSGNLVIRNLATGEQWNLTNKDSNSGDFADLSAISPDSTKVIYYWFNAEKEDFDLRVVELDGSGDRLLWGATEGARSFNMDSWSPDSKYIYGEYLEEEPVRLMRVAIVDGSRQVIKTFDEKRFFTVSNSPDGRYIAYDCAKNKSSNRDIYIYDFETKTEQPLIQHTANDKLLGWTPDGEHIFFTSDRNGTWDAWLLQVADGKPVGLPEVIKTGIGDVSPIGFTQCGSFYYTFNHQAWNVYTAKVDLDAGEVVSEPKPVRHVGHDGLPDWSPDGRYLAYLSELDNNKPQIIHIRTLATGQERELKTDLPYFRFIHWCPDSCYLLITDFKDLSVVYRLDVKTGEHTELVRLLQSEGQKIKQAELSSDGKTLVYRIRGRGTANSLVVKDMQTGHEKELLQTEGRTVLAFAAGWALSPDGKKIAFSIREGTDSPYVLKIISVETGNIKDTGINDVWQIIWTDDGNHFVFTKTNNLKELWTVPIEQGEPKKLLECNEMLLFPSIHPDGQRIAFFSGGYVSEMWVMKKFLPEAIAMGK